VRNVAYLFLNTSQEIEWRVIKAKNHAIKLCGGGKDDENDPFKDN
jgi:hypothetical protein